MCQRDTTPPAEIIDKKQKIIKDSNFLMKKKETSTPVEITDKKKIIKEQLSLKTNKISVVTAMVEFDAQEK